MVLAPEAMLKFSLFFGLLGLLALPVACGDDDDDSTAAAGGTCEDNCDLQVAAGCAKTPAGYGDLCKQLCVSVRAKVSASCQGQLKAYEACTARAEYTCVNDLPQITVTGLCGNEASACASCNGSLCAAF